MDNLPSLAWTADVTAETLNVTQDYVKNLHRCGKLVGVKIGRNLRWRSSDDHELVERLGGDDAS